MHLALYRKYRPKTFDEVVGQEHITTTLKNEVALGKPAHAYLFTGSRGTGKTSCAKIMAKALNCVNQRDGNPCCACDICRGVDDGTLMDVVEIDAASNNGVDNIRDLRDEANFTPAVGKYRVYIIDEAHMLSAGAFNALLKIMEEPPQHVIFILATTEVHKIPATILSRCQRFDFKRISGAEIAQRLAYIGKEENIELSQEAALLIAHLSDGGMRDAVSLLDLCSSYSGEVSVETVNQAAGVVGQAHLFDLADCIVHRQVQQVIAIVDDLSQRSLDPERLCEQLITHYRNLMIARAVPHADSLVSCLPSDLPKLAEQGKAYSMESILYALTVLQDALGRMSQSTLRRTELEMALVKLCSPALSTQPEAVLARLEQLEMALRTGSLPAQRSEHPAKNGQESLSDNVPQAKTRGVPCTAEPPSNLSAKPSPAKEQSAGTPKGEAVLLTQWPDVLARLEKSNPALQGALCNSTAYQSGSYVLVNYKDDLFLKLIRGNDYAKESLKQAIFEVTGKKYNIGPYREEQYTVKKIIDPLEQFVENLQLPQEHVTIK